METVLSTDTMSRAKVTPFCSLVAPSRRYVNRRSNLSNLRTNRNTAKFRVGTLDEELISSLSFPCNFHKNLRGKCRKTKKTPRGTHHQRVSPKFSVIFPPGALGPFKISTKETRRISGKKTRKMVKGRRVRAVVACARNDDCCSPHPKRRGQKITAVLQPNAKNSITAFFQTVDEDLDEKKPPLADDILEPLSNKNPQNEDDILLKLMKDEDVKCEVKEGPLTPHRIELCLDDAKQKATKAKKRLMMKDNHKVTDYFPVRRSVRKTKTTVMEEKQRTLEQLLRNNIEEGLEVKIFADKGRGVVTSRPFTKGDFVVEYSGDLIDINEAKKREIKYAQDKNTGCYMYYFKHNDQQYCVDATTETGKLGRLVNHSRTGNLITRTVSVDSRPRLVLIAKDDIKAGEEVTYDYGDRSKESLKYHPWLAY